MSRTLGETIADKPEGKEQPGAARRGMVATQQTACDEV